MIYPDSAGFADTQPEDAFNDWAPAQNGPLTLLERTARIGSWTLLPPWDTLICTDQCAAILGVIDGSPLSMTSMAARFSTEWRATIAKYLHDCLHHGTPFDEEMQVVGAGRRRIWVRAVGEAIRDASGRIVRLQGVVHDVSAQKQAQRETLRLAMRLTTTLASITEAFVTLDRQHCYSYLNPESERLLQHTTGELLGKEVWYDRGPAMTHQLREQLPLAVQHNQRVEFEEYCASLGKWLEVRAYPFTEGLAIYFRDVTERRKAQEQLMLLQTGVSRLNDIVVIAEALQAGETAPNIVFVNDAFENLTGYRRDEVVGKTPRLLLGPDLQLFELRRMSAALQSDRQVRGELRIYRRDDSWFWLELEVVAVLSETGELTHWVAVGRDVTQRKAAEDEIHHLAFFDALTGLPNRQLLLDRLKGVLSLEGLAGRHGALMFIDIDNFKVLNDTIGHHKGDLLLQKVADRLTHCVRKTDTVARLGGDEFVVMLSDLGGDPVVAEVRARIVAEKVLTRLREPFDLDGHRHFATSSIGVTALGGGTGDDLVSEPLKQADLAMYQAKALGRNTVCFFDPAMQAVVSANAAVSADLRTGLRDRQFLLHYQPIMDRGGRIAGVEALLRWQHPQRGLVGPTEFIPVAEDTGLILPLGQWALETACAQLAVWARSPQTAGLSVAVNVSVRQFRHPDFVDMVMAAIQKTGIPPQRLKLELTESLLADRMEITLARMGTLKALGVTMSLDDFGMGYSSLSMLKRMPLDQLKIDRSFVADVLVDPNDAAISRAIIALAQSLNLEVVAEGVETEAQRVFLADQGCGYYQGHLFCEPLSIDQLERFMHGKTTAPAPSP